MMLRRLRLPVMCGGEHESQLKRIHHGKALARSQRRLLIASLRSSWNSKGGNRLVQLV